MRRDAHAPPDAQVFVVGGAVRDELLGLAVRDRDWVVVGTTPQAMLDAGFLAVGRDFPVFLHPQTHEEYALARSERKTGPGYRGFSVHAAPEVTLEQDLARRDLTINAIARAADGTLIDPYGGRRDIAAGVLRHVSPAFAEDPVRILRVARFAARFTCFTVAPETMALMRQMVDSGEVDALVPERVWQEFARGLMEQRPSRMFEVLRDCGALARLLPEVARLWGVPPRAEHHPEVDTGAAAATHARDTAPGSAAAVIASGLRSPEGAPLRTCGSAAADDPADARPGSAAAVIASGLRSPEGAPLTTCGDHLMMRLNMSAQLDAPLTVRYACLGHDLGKGVTPADALSRHIGHEQHSVALLRGVNERLRVPTDCAELAEVVAREHGNVHRSGEFGAAALLRLLERCDAFRKPARFREVLLACECDARGRLGFENTVYEPAPRLAAALTAAQALDTAQVAAAAAARGERGPAVGAAIQRERIAAVAAALVVPIGPDWTE